MGSNVVEKIAVRFAADAVPGMQLHAGDFISIRPAHIMTHDNTGAVIPKFKQIGAAKLANPLQVVHTLDHNIQDTTEANKTKYKKIEEFSRSMGCDFYPAGRGIGHQIMVEEGYAFPGTLVVASDSHSNMYGGLGCLGTPIVRTDAAAIWATGRTWWQVPPVAKVILNGKLHPGVTGKDVIISLCGTFKKDEVLNHIVEFSGDGVAALSIDERLAIANMTTEWGTLGGIFPIDGVTIAWLRARADFIAARGLEGVPSDVSGNGVHPRLNHARIDALERDIPNLLPDTDAVYTKEIALDLSSVQPHISGPNTVKVMKSAAQAVKENIPVHKAYLVSCVNSRAADIAQAAEVVRGKKIAEQVKFYIAAASREVQNECEKSGDWQALLEAGAIPLPPGCGPCIGLGTGLLEDGETGISATNRNFKGRMGSANALAYLASPAVVAASALSGRIDVPFAVSDAPIIASITALPKPPRPVSEVTIVPGFPESMHGEIIFCHQDNLNTDGIYPGKYTYVDDFTPEDQARVVMENYDPEFGKIASTGDILAGGYNFGTGSSREQAATALKYRGIGLVIAGSFSETYKRNALNNGFLAIDVPELIDDLKERFGTEQLTVKTGITVTVDFKHSKIIAEGKEYAIGAVGPAAQELVIFGGLENWVKEQISKETKR